MIKYEIKIIQSVSHDQETFFDLFVENAYLAVVLDPQKPKNLQSFIFVAGIDLNPTEVLCFKFTQRIFESRWCNTSASERRVFSIIGMFLSYISTLYLSQISQPTHIFTGSFLCNFNLKEISSTKWIETQFYHLYLIV